ncbi:MAG: hypothetical protein KIS76_00180 [Pyrinomonadaceae bacterium]|nr:hypothetical protein [Pyrinomonadaceae bacterium]
MGYSIRKTIVRAKLLFYGFLILCLNSGIYAQYRIDNWTTEQGLPQNSVNDLIQSSDGYIWGVTNGGIFRFDGVRFKFFNKSNSEGLEESRFLIIESDGGGRIWFLSDRFTLVKYEDGQFTSYLKDKDYEGTIKSSFLFTDINGNLIFNTDRGNYVYENGKFVRFEIPTSSNSSRIIFRDRKGGVWLTENTGSPGEKNTGIRRVFRGQAQYYTFPKEQHHSAMPKMFEDRFGNIWLYFTPRAVYRIRRGIVRDFEEMKYTFDFAEDAKGNLWTGNDGGFSVLDATELDKEEINFDRYQKLSPMADFDKNRVDSLTVDREGGIWMGTFNAGLIYASPKTFEVYSKADWNTEKDVCYPIFEDSKKNVWVGVWTDALIKYDENDNFRVLNPDPIGNLPTALFEDDQQRLWIAALGAVGYLKDEKFVRLPDRINVYDINQDDNGDILMGSGSGLARYNGVDLKIFTTKDGLANDEITKIYKTKSGQFLIGTRRGLSVYTDGKFNPLSEQEFLTNDEIRSIYQDAESTIWVGTYDYGLIRYKDGKFKRITKNDGLLNQNVFCTLEDDKGWFWINTNNGIYRVRKEQLNDFADGKIERVEIISYNKKDGLLNLEGNGGKQPAGIKRSNGELWFPTQKGVAIVNPNEIPVNKLPPPVHIEEISIDKKDIGKYDEIIEIQPGQENLEINYTGISFTNPELVKFRYRLEGLEAKWNEAGTRRTAFYNNIPPGEYTFHVIAANRDGVWNTEGATIKVEKLPFYYQTWWFKILTVLSAFGIIIYFFYERISHFMQIAETKTEYSRRLIESQEAERKRLASELHDGLGQELIIIKNRAMLAIGEDEDREAMEKEINTISETAANALIGIREITNNLRPQTLDRLGLTKALKSMVRKVSEVIEIESEIDSIDDLIAKDEEINIYRIVQEALNNIIKHSNAENALVEIKRQKKRISIIIKDNGKGFDTAKIKPDKGGLGLVGLRERTQLLGGEILIDSKFGKGTTIEVFIPL